MGVDSALKLLGFGAKFAAKKTKKEKKIQSKQLAQKPTNVPQPAKIHSESLREQNGADGSPITLLGQITSEVGVKTKESGGKRKRRRSDCIDDEKLSLLHKEEVNRLRNLYKIHIYGTDLPDPSCSFADLASRFNFPNGLSERIESLGYITPTPIQMQSIPVMCEKRELLASAPTGSGKTLAFLIPIVCHLREPKSDGFRAIIVCPVRELARQIFYETLRLVEGTGLRVHMITKPSKAHFAPDSKKKFDILVTTPKRLMSLLTKDPVAIDVAHLEWLVVDESDKLFEEGQNSFRDQLGEIYKRLSNPQVRHAFFSATYTHEVEQWCKLNMDNVVTVSIGVRNTAVKSVEQKLIFTGDEHGKLVELRNMFAGGVKPPVLVFVDSKDQAKQLHLNLRREKLKVDVIHADRDQQDRDEVVRKFRDGSVWILICTELLGRGIDFKGVNTVVNYDLPSTVISYIHRIGRTGRAGRSGTAITFFTEQDKPLLRSIANVLKEAGCSVPEYMLQLKPESSNRKRKRSAKPKSKPDHHSDQEET